MNYFKHFVLVCENCGSENIKVEEKDPTPPKMTMEEWEKGAAFINFYNTILEATCQECGNKVKRGFRK